MPEPLDWVVERAVEVAMQSPCLSKRGVVVWFDGNFISSGFNHQPAPFICDGSERCKRDCGKTAIHAEQMAILHGNPTLLRGASMLHVKAKDGLPCASMAPSCLQCSKLILASGIAWMHLAHDPCGQKLGAETVGTVRGWKSDGGIGDLEIRRYSAARFHWLTADGFHGIKLSYPTKVATLAGLEPATPTLEASCSIHLSYRAADVSSLPEDGAAMSEKGE